MKYKEQTLKTKCTNCSKDIELSGYAQWCNIILRHKPACSYECNKALGQISLSKKEKP